MDSPVCTIGPTIEFVEKPVASANKFCVVTFDQFEKQSIPLAPGGSASATALGGGPSMVRAPDVDEATASQIITALKNPTQIVGFSVSGPGGYEPSTVGEASISCPATRQN